MELELRPKYYRRSRCRFYFSLDDNHIGPPEYCVNIWTYNGVYWAFTPFSSQHVSCFFMILMFLCLFFTTCLVVDLSNISVWWRRVTFEGGALPLKISIHVVYTYDNIVCHGREGRGTMYLLEGIIRHANTQNIGRLLWLLNTLWVILNCWIIDLMVPYITYM